ncbi:MAG: zf-TFIIB domain-containing protein [Candidatus Nealsonbacteria bacterium]
MRCPNCKKHLSSSIVCNVEVNHCPNCLGVWFDEGELRLAKDNKDENLNWLDIELWKYKEKFKISHGERHCPDCRLPLYEVYYGDSGIIVDVCNVCHGIWLDRAEFRKIINWLKKRADYEVINNYSRTLFKQMLEIFTGPETLKDEILDVITILKLLNYKFAVQHPVLSKIISLTPR